MARRKSADEAIEAEIARLNKLPTVKLAQKEQRLLMARKKRLYDLRWLEKRGKFLQAEGWTLDTLELMFKDNPETPENTEE